MTKKQPGTAILTKAAATRLNVGAGQKVWFEDVGQLDHQPKDARMMQGEHLPGTEEVQWWADRLTGGQDEEFIQEAGGILQFAQLYADTGCNCTRDPQDAECLSCEAVELLRALGVYV